MEVLTTSTNLTEALKFWRDGVTKANITFKIKNSSSIGFKMLADRLMDMKAEIPLRSFLIAVVLTARNPDGQTVFNNGEVCYVENIKKFKKRFLLTSSVEEWQKVENAIANRGVHQYRAKKNRHGHGNELKSYYGQGHNKLLEYLKTMTNEELDEYRDAHRNCCDMWNSFSAFYDWRYNATRERDRVSKSKSRSRSRESSNSSSSSVYEEAEQKTEVN